MARQPEPPIPKPLTKSELAELKRRLSLLSADGVEREYRIAYERCTLACGMPSPTAIQQLVTAWKVLRNWRR